jgi:hypothetical protein
MLRWLALLVLLLAPGAHAQMLADWIADSRTGCKLWNPFPQANETLQWNGPCVDGLAHGAGIARWFLGGLPNGRAEGTWVAGRKMGRGISVLPNGVRIEGDYVNDELNGRATMASPTGDRFEGQFVAGVPNGPGKFTMGNGERYEGEFWNGLPNGQGSFFGRDADGRAFTLSGAWKDGCFKQEKDGTLETAAVMTTREACGFK